jgi:predicted kinase
MAYVVVVRGPLGVGKSTVAVRLARELGAGYVSIDRTLDDHGLWVEGLLPEFLAANVIAAGQADAFLESGVPVIFDGNFYSEAQLEDLLARLDFRHFIFTLRVSLRVCIERDSRRRPPHGPEAARAVYAKTTAFEYGVDVDAERPIETVVQEVRSLLRQGLDPK